MSHRTAHCTRSGLALLAPAGERGRQAFSGDLVMEIRRADPSDHMALSAIRRSAIVEGPTSCGWKSCVL